MRKMNVYKIYKIVKNLNIDKGVLSHEIWSTSETLSE